MINMSIRFPLGLAIALLGMAGVALTSRAADPGTSPPLVQVFAADPAGAETGSDPAMFRVLRTGPTEAPLTVAYEVGGTALNGVDYESIPGTVTIRRGDAFASIPILPLDDFLTEGWEHVVVRLVQPHVWPPPYLVDWPGMAVAYIEDNDLGQVNQPPNVALLAPPDGAVFQAPVAIELVARASDPDGRVLSVEFFAGTDSLGVVTPPPWPPIYGVPGLEEDGTVEFPDLDLLPEFGAPLVEVPRWLFRLVWPNPPPGVHVLRALATDNRQGTAWSDHATITVVAVPPQPVVTVAATDPEASEVGPSGTHTDTGVFTLYRTGSTANALTVWYRLSGTAGNGADYRELPASVMFPPDQSAVDVVVEPIDDLLVEGEESVVIALLPPVADAADVSTADGYVVGRPCRARMVIHDNDDPPNRPPQVRIVQPHNDAMFLAPATVVIVAQAFDLDGQVVAVEFFEGDNSLGIVKPPTLTPTTVSARPAFVLEWSPVPPGRYVLTAVATDNDGATARSRPVAIHVLPPTVPPVVEIETIDPIASEPGVLTVIDPAIMRVSRTGSTARPLTVFYAVGGTAANGIDYHEIPGRITIPAESESADLVIDPLHDLLVEGLETVLVKLEDCPFDSSGASVPDCYYIVGPRRAAKAVIRDNDGNLPPKAEIVAPADGAVFVNPAEIEIQVVTVDPDGWVPKMQFFADGVLIGEREMMFFVAPPPGEPQTFSFTWKEAPLGRHTLTARAIDNLGAPGVTDPVHIVVVGHQTFPVVTIVATRPFTREPNIGTDPAPDPAVFLVTRRGGDMSVPLRVFYRVGGTALNGVDYKHLAGEVTIEAAQVSAPIFIHALADDLLEGTELVVIALVQPDGATSDTQPPVGWYIVGQPSRDVAYIRDNQTPNRPPKVTMINPPNGARFVAPVDLRLVASAQDPDGWVRCVEFFDGDRSLGIVWNRLWVIEPTQLSELGTTVLSGLEAAPIPIPPPFVFEWSDVPVGTHVLTAVATDNDGDTARSAPVSIEVLEASHPPIVTVFAIDGLAREGAANTAAFRICRAGPTRDPLTVHFRVEGTAGNGTDYTRISSPIVVPAGRHSVPIRVVPIDDNLPEPPETVIVTLEPSPLDVFPPPYVVGLPATAGALIVDNDHLVRPTTSLADGTMHLRFGLDANLPYRLEGSVNLFDWTPVSEGFSVVDDGIDFLDADKSHYPYRFYRVVPALDLEPEGD